MLLWAAIIALDTVPAIMAEGQTLHTPFAAARRVHLQFGKWKSCFDVIICPDVRGGSLQISKANDYSYTAHTNKL